MAIPPGLGPGCRGFDSRFPETKILRRMDAAGLRRRGWKELIGVSDWNPDSRFPEKS